MPPLEPPSRAVLAGRAVVSDRKPTPAETFSYTPIEGSYFGVSRANGSALAGLLLGPLGVAGNILYMDVLRSLSLDLLTAFRDFRSKEELMTPARALRSAAWTP